MAKFIFRHYKYLLALIGCMALFSLFPAKTSLAFVEFRDGQKSTTTNRDFSSYCSSQLGFDPSRLVKQSKSLNLGYLKDQSCWVVLEVNYQGSSDKKLILEHNYAQTDVIQLYQSSNETDWHLIGEAGNLVPLPKWRMQNRLPSFDITLKPGLNRIRIMQRARDISIIDYKLWEPEAFYKQVNIESFFLGGFFSICLALSLYNFFIFLANREIQHFLYFCYLITYAAANFILCGLFKVTFLPHDWLIIGELNVAVVSLSLAFTYLFVYNFLKISSFPRPLHLTYAIVAIFTSLNLFNVLISPLQITAQFCLITTGFASLLILAAAIYSLRSGFPLAKIFLISWSTLIVGNAIHVFLLAGLVESAAWSKSASYVGAVIEAVMISYALARKMKTENASEIKRRQHAYSQLEKMVYPHQLEQIKSGQALETTMPTHTEQACVLSFDIVRSSQIKHVMAKQFFRKVFQRCNELMSEGYDGTELKARAYRIKEMGDGFLCSIGYPFASLTANPAIEAVELAECFAKILDEESAVLANSEPIICGIGIALDTLGGFYPEAGTKEYDLFGPGLILATRYEGMRKVLFASEKNRSMLIIQEAVYNQLDAPHRTTFEQFNIKEQGISVRDDSTATKLFYRFLDRKSRDMPSDRQLRVV